jgi:predicted nucleotidyltransferase
MKLHKHLPISGKELQSIVSDILILYPESDSIYIVGTYARHNETPESDKEHDIDILIHFPVSANRTKIEHRNDDALWNKWSGYKKQPIIDFLMMFGKEEPKYGKHIWRLSNKLKTPKQLIWRK